MRVRPGRDRDWTDLGAVSTAPGVGVAARRMQQSRKYVGSCSHVDRERESDCKLRAIHSPAGWLPSFDTGCKFSPSSPTRTRLPA